MTQDAAPVLREVRDPREQREVREIREARESRPRREQADRSPRDFGDRPRRGPADPIFDKPYEPSVQPSADKPAWEQKAAAPTTTVRGLSPNIRTKRKLASLLGGSKG